MSSAVLAALITSGSALLVAVVGAVSSLVVSLRTRRSALEQVRYERAHERRDEVLSTIYAYLYRIQAQMETMIIPSDGGPGPIAKSVEVRTKVVELQEYYREHAIWLSAGTVRVLDDLTHTYATHASEYDGAVNNLEDRSEMDRVAERIRGWLNKESSPTLRNLREEFRAILGIEER